MPKLTKMRRTENYRLIGCVQVEDNGCLDNGSYDGDEEKTIKRYF